MKLRVSHLTRYEYAQAVSFSPHALYFRPRETPALRLHRFAYNINPSARSVGALDAYGNVSTVAHFWDRSNELSIRAESEVETVEANPFDFLVRADCVRAPVAYEAYEQYVLAAYLTPTDPRSNVAVQAWLRESGLEQIKETLPLLTALSRLIFDHVRYAGIDDAPIQSAVATLQERRGAARDFATLTIAACRALGFAARYVSGYLFTDADDRQHTPNAMHAWTEVYLPGAGWKGLDATHGLFCTDAYIPVAHGPQGECVGAVQGSYYSTVAVPAQRTTTVLVEKR